MDRFFDVPLNLPHAATVASRVLQRIEELDGGSSNAALLARELAEELARYRFLGDPEPAEAMVTQADAIERSRSLLVSIEEAGIKGDRLGQAVRNLFECLGYGREGAAAGLRAGENPDSLQRP